MKRKIEEYRKNPDKFLKEMLGEEPSKWQKELMKKFLKLPKGKPVLRAHQGTSGREGKTPAWFEKLQDICRKKGVYQRKAVRNLETRPILIYIDESEELND